MKHSMITLALAGLLVGFSASATEKTVQQQKMGKCNERASSLAFKGEVRKKFMSDCLKKDSKLAEMSPQQIKMKSCNLEASDKKFTGDARKAHMKKCLKNN